MAAGGEPADGAPTDGKEPNARPNGGEAETERERTDARRVAVFGGVYSNWLALEEVVEDARSRGAEELYCLGDLGAFGPNPDKVFPRLREAGVKAIRGNYDDSISRGLDDCQCGYTDPRDNHFARLSYRYTFRNTSPRWREWMGTLPEHRRVRMNGTEVLMCHGSPRRMNEFLWESATSTQFLEWLADEHRAGVILATHTGIHWKRRLSDGRLFVNVGCIGRPANDGRTEVWYALLDVASGDGDRGEGAADDGAAGEGEVEASFVPVAYDHRRLAEEMRAESLPEEFVETILTGWWTTCLEVLPAKERGRGRY